LGGLNINNNKKIFPISLGMGDYTKNSFPVQEAIYKELQGSTHVTIIIHENRK